MTVRNELTTKFDLASVKLPEMKPLRGSFDADDAEQDLRKLFLDLFRSNLAGSAYDVNVSGAMHLGSYDLVRRAVNADGLLLLQGERSEAAVRYLYRAWRARNRNGRGFFFLKTYLQILFPNLCQVAQLWQKKDESYPYGLWSVLDDNPDGTPFVPDPEKYWLTSRVEIGLDLSITTRSITTLTNVFRSIIPARLVPQFRFWLRFNAELNMSIEKFLLMEKFVEARYPWTGYRIMRLDDAGVWNLGRDTDTSYYIRLGGTPVEFSTAMEKSMQARYPWSELVIAREGDDDVWSLGTDKDPDERYLIQGWKISFDIETVKVS